MIQGYFINNASYPMPMVRIAVDLPGIVTAPAVLEFLIDTGAAVSCIHPADAIARMRIRAARLSAPDQWSRTTEYRGVGGAAMYYLAAARDGFLHQDERTQIFEQDIQIAQLRTDNQTLPSILGWDIIQHFKLVADWRNRLLTLE